MWWPAAIPSQNTRAHCSQWTTWSFSITPKWSCQGKAVDAACGGLPGFQRCDHGDRTWYQRLVRSHEYSTNSGVQRSFHPNRTRATLLHHAPTIYWTRNATSRRLHIQRLNRKRLLIGRARKHSTQGTQACVHEIRCCNLCGTRAFVIVSIPSFQHVTECTLHRHCRLTLFLPCLLSFSVCPQTEAAQFYNTQSDLCVRTPHMDRTRPSVFNHVCREISVIVTSHMVADTSLDFIQ